MSSSHLILVAALVGCIAFPFNSLGDTGPAGAVGSGISQPGPLTRPTAPSKPEISNPMEGDIEDIDIARYRLATDFASCLKMQQQMVDECMVQRGWISVHPPGQNPGATLPCRAIKSGNGVYVTFCP